METDKRFPVKTYIILWQWILTFCPELHSQKLNKKKLIYIEIILIGK